MGGSKPFLRRPGAVKDDDGAEAGVIIAIFSFSETNCKQNGV